MFRFDLRRLRLEKRRVLICFGLLPVCLIARLFERSGVSGVLELAAFAAFAGAVALIVLTALLLLVAVWPLARVMIDFLSMGAIVLLARSLLGLVRGGGAGSQLELVFSLVVLFLLYALYCLPWADRFFTRRAMRYTVKARSGLAPEALWPFIAATPDNNPCALSTRMGEFTWIEEGRRYSYSANLKRGIRLDVEILALTPPERMLVRFAVLGPQAKAFANPEGVTETLVARMAHGAEVTQISDVPGMTRRQRFLIWLDDGFTRLIVEAILDAERNSPKEPHSAAT